MAIRCGLANVAPPSVDLAKDIPLTRPLRHDTYTSPSFSTAMSQPWTAPSDTMCPREKLTPWSVDREK